MRHIYIFNNATRAAEYGIGTYINQMLCALREVPQLYITLINLNTEKTQLTVEQESIRIIQIPVIKYPSTDANYYRYYRNLLYALIPHIRIEDENIFHLNYLHNRPIASLLKQQYPDCRILLTIHYMDWCFTLKGNTSLFKRILAKTEGTKNNQEEEIYQDFQNDSRLFKEVDRIICLSKYTSQLLYTTYNIPIEKITLIYNGLEDKAIFLTKAEKKQKKQSLLFDKEDKIILFVGRLDEIKGLDVLIKAFREVLHKEPKARLLIVGDGNFKTYMEEATDLAGRITYTGKVNKEQLYEYYQIATVGVMPSFHEQCSYVGIEMMMHGIPLIGTDSTGLSEMVEEECRLHIDENNKSLIVLEELSGLLSTILSNSPNNDLRTKYRKRYENNYSLSAMKTKFLHLLNT